MDSLLWLEGLETQRHILNQPQEKIRGHHRNPEIAKSRRGSVESETEGPGAGIEVHQETGTRCLSDLVKKGPSSIASILTLSCLHRSITSSIATSIFCSSMRATRSRAKDIGLYTPIGGATTMGAFMYAVPSGCWMISQMNPAAHAWYPKHTVGPGQAKFWKIRRHRTHRRTI